MITQSLYVFLQEAVKVKQNDGEIRLTNTTEEVRVGIWVFQHPHKLVIHRPTKRGFYLNDKFKHIIDVCNCREPIDAYAVERSWIDLGGELPMWAQMESPIDFDTFWLY